MLPADEGGPSCITFPMDDPPDVTRVHGRLVPTFVVEILLVSRNHPRFFRSLMNERNRLSAFPALREDNNPLISINVSDAVLLTWPGCINVIASIGLTTAFVSLIGIFYNFNSSRKGHLPFSKPKQTVDG